MDEAHGLKNRNSVRSRKLRLVARACRHRIMLTGTPLQNNLGELQNLLSFVLPEMFAGSAEELDFAANAKDATREVALIGRMKKLLGPFVLRRLKSEISEQLVTKSHALKDVEMTGAQAELYSQARRRGWGRAAGLRARCF